MDAETRRQLIEQKLAAVRLKVAANRQRQDFERLLQKLPAEIADVLQTAPQILIGDRTSVESEKITFPFAPDNLLDSDGRYKGSDRPADYFYKQFGWEHKLLTALSQIPRVHESKPAYLYLYDGDIHYPLFTLPLGWLQQHLHILAATISLTLYIRTTDGQQGIYMSHHVGYVKDDHSPEETVYELTIYGHGQVSL